MDMNEYQSGEATAGNDTTMLTYVIRAKTKVIKASWLQGLKGGRTEYKAVLLIPIEGDTTTMFYRAWLPVVSDEYFEIVMEMGHPVYGTCRGAILRRGKYYSKPHILIMTKGVEEILAKKDGLRIENIKILPSSQDDRSDEAVDSDMAVERFDY